MFLSITKALIFLPAEISTLKFLIFDEYSALSRFNPVAETQFYFQDFIFLIIGH